MPARPIENNFCKRNLKSFFTNGSRKDNLNISRQVYIRERHDRNKTVFFFLVFFFGVAVNSKRGNSNELQILQRNRLLLQLKSSKGFTRWIIFPSTIFKGLKENNAATNHLLAHRTIWKENMDLWKAPLKYMHDIFICGEKRSFCHVLSVRTVKIIITCLFLSRYEVKKFLHKLLLLIAINIFHSFYVGFKSAQWFSQPQNTTWKHQGWFIYFDSISSKLKSIFLSRTSSSITFWLSNEFNDCLIQKHPSTIHTVDLPGCNLFKIRSILHFRKNFFFLLSILQISKRNIIVIWGMSCYGRCAYAQLGAPRRILSSNMSDAPWRI